MAEITPAELSARRSGDEDRPIVIDVQRERDNHDWHIPGSTNLGIYDALQNDPATAKEILSTIPKNHDVVVAGNAGDASLKAAELLHEMGYDVSTLRCSR